MEYSESKVILIGDSLAEITDFEIVEELVQRDSRSAGSMRCNTIELFTIISVLFIRKIQLL